MKVIKRDGRTQDFEIDKIKLTLERVSDEINMPFTHGDVERVAHAIERSINNIGTDTITSSKIHEIVIGELNTLGFIEIAKAYDGYKKSFKG
ncbi:MAG: ATP cone domain-containing protein [Xylanivirga thermophila]|uniref:ATP cone domain-containing protein n=1 Tax=Xylanivirga thermophila TaxID=2496273 RepID=UPI0013EB3558|nr:ATP cone domain-containing protein [Xylanivirga thermophila]